MCMNMKLQHTKCVLVSGSLEAPGSWQAINSSRPLSLTRRTMMDSVTDWYAPLQRREVVRYAGQVLSRECFLRYGHHAAGFSCLAAVSFQRWYCFTPSLRTRPGKRVVQV